jgi:hypothetical protein
LLSDLACSRLEEQARHALDVALAHLEQLGVSAVGHIQFGHPADAIARHVTAFHADIVVIGHRVQTGLSRWWGERPVHLDLAERLRGATIVTVTPPAA